MTSFMELMKVLTFEFDIVGTPRMYKIVVCDLLHFLLQMNYSLGYKQFFSVFQEGELKNTYSVLVGGRRKRDATENFAGKILGRFRVGLSSTVGTCR